MEVDWPLFSNKIRRGMINHTFGMVRRRADGSPRPHQGWDFEALIGTDAFAIADGTVVFVRDNQGDYGTQLCMSFQHKGITLYAFYAHLQHVYVWSGERVSLGRRVATTGETGNARGMAAADQHLHFEIRTRANCGPGLTDRLSPIEVFGICPLSATQFKNSMLSRAR